MDKGYNRFIIDRIRIERVILRIEGYYEGEVPVEDLPGVHFFLEDAKKRIYPIEVAELDPEKRRFSLWCHLMILSQGLPLPTGKYALKAEAGQTVVNVLVAESLQNLDADGNIVGRTAGSGDGEEAGDVYSFYHRKNTALHGTESYSVESRADRDSGAFWLNVETQFEIEYASAGMLFKHMLRIIIGDLKELIKPLRSRMGRAYFNHYARKRIRENIRSGYTRKPRILFASEARSELGGNEAFVYNRMKERGLFDQYDADFFFRASLKKRLGLGKMLQFVRKMAMADIILIDDVSQFSYQFDYPKDVTFIQIWHACGAFKTIGMERLGKDGAPKINTRVHKCYTDVPVSSIHSARHHAEAFALPMSVFKTTGVPRTDMFFDENVREKTLQHLRGLYPVLTEREKVYLYAPTFRGKNAVDASFPFEQLHLEEWGRWLKEKNRLLIIKMHPFVSKKVPIPEEYRDYILDCSEYREVNDILFAADVLITDYSSVMYEFSLLRRPIYFYAFDEQEYVQTRDFYESYKDTVCGEIIHDFPNLLHTLDADTFDYEELDRFVHKNFTYTDGKATDRVIDQIILRPRQRGTVEELMP